LFHIRASLLTDSRTTTIVGFKPLIRAKILRRATLTDSKAAFIANFSAEMIVDLRAKMTSHSRASNMIYVRTTSIDLRDKL